MQISTAYLYQNWIRCQLITDPSIKTRNTMIYSHPIRIYKNIDNPIRFEFKNQDQKRVNINGYRIFMYIFNSSSLTSNLTSVAGSRNQAERWQDTDDSTMLDLDDGSTLFDQANQSGHPGAILVKELYVLDDGSTSSSKGIATTVITKEDLDQIHGDDYHYSIKATLPGNFDTPVYTDVNFGARGTIQILSGHYPPN